MVRLLACPTKPFFATKRKQRSMVDLQAIHDLTLVASRDSFLFQPITFETFRNLFHCLLERIEPDWIQLAEIDGQVIGVLSNEREISVRYHLCEAPEGPVPGKWYRTLISRSKQSWSTVVSRRRSLSFFRPNRASIFCS